MAESEKNKNGNRSLINRGSFVILDEGKSVLFAYSYPRIKIRYFIPALIITLFTLIVIQLMEPPEYQQTAASDYSSGNKVESDHDRLTARLIEKIDELRITALLLRENSLEISSLMMETDYVCEPVRSSEVDLRLQEILCPGAVKGVMSFASFYSEDMIHIPHLSPLPKRRIFITSAFGYRSSVFRGGPGNKEYHRGVDLRASIGEPVAATASGYVTRVILSKRGYGNMIELKHAFGHRTIYAHLSGVNVKKGDRIYPGMIIGRTGNTGYSTGPHLHYEIRQSSGELNPSDYFVR